MRDVLLWVICPILLATAAVYGTRARRGYKEWVRELERGGRK